jgi:hypothetical protein
MTEGGAFAAQGEQRPEVGIGRDKDAPFLACALEDLFVVRALQSVVADVRRVVAGGGETVVDKRGERVVEEEPQPAAIGSSRSRTASAA